MKWIKHYDGKIERGNDDLPDGDVHFIDEQGSKAIIKGKLYINGVLVKKGQHIINNYRVDTDTKGKITKKVKGGDGVV